MANVPDAVPVTVVTFAGQLEDPLMFAYTIVLFIAPPVIAVVLLPSVRVGAYKALIALAFIVPVEIVYVVLPTVSELIVAFTVFAATAAQLTSYKIQK